MISCITAKGKTQYSAAHTHLKALLISPGLVAKAMSDSMGPEGLVPSMFVFQAMPSPPFINKPLPEQMERIAAFACKVTNRNSCH